MFAAATSLFARSALAANYAIHTGSPHGSLASSPAFGQSSSSASGPVEPALGTDFKPFQVGLWRVLRATNKTTQKVRLRTSSEVERPAVDELTTRFRVWPTPSAARLGLDV